MNVHKLARRYSNNSMNNLKYIPELEFHESTRIAASYTKWYWTYTLQRKTWHNQQTYESAVCLLMYTAL